MSTTVSDSWSAALGNLQSFIQTNPRLEVEANSLCIPEDLRPEFFRLFDTVTLAFIRQEHQALTENARPLSASYIAAEQTVVQSLKLEGVLLPAELDRFLHNPAPALASLARNPLFDFIRGKIDQESFHRQVVQSVEESYRTLYYTGYIRWVVLALVSLLCPDELFEVSISKLMDEDAVFHDRHQRRDVPEPARTQRLAFKDESFVTFLVPDFIAGISSTGKFVSFKAQAGKPTSPAKEVSEERSWLSPPGLLDLRSSLLLYVDSKPKNLALIAESQRFCQPDLLIQFVDMASAAQPDPQKAADLSRALQPARGSGLIFLDSQVTQPQNPSERQSYVHEYQKALAEYGIFALDAGFDKGKLEPVRRSLLDKAAGGG